MSDYKDFIIGLALVPVVIAVLTTSLFIAVKWLDFLIRRFM